jgi:apolipoprotein N-acyltransferase
VSPRDASLALLLTVAALVLLRVSKNPRVPRGNAILIELCLGLVSVGASVFWLKILALAWS